MNYKEEIVRLIAQMSMGTGALALIGGTVVVVGFLTMAAGALIAVQGYNQLAGIGVEALTGFVSAYINVRVIAPVNAGIALAATIGAGATAQMGAMRISEEIDALEVMGIQPVTFLAATRLLAAWMVLPFMYLAAIGVGFIASYIAVVEQIGDTSSGGYLLIFWMFQNPPDLIFSVIKGMSMATAIVLVGCYYGYTAGGGPVGVGTATAKSMVLNIVLVHIIGMMGTLVFWGANPRAPIGG